MFKHKSWGPNVVGCSSSEVQGPKVESSVGCWNGSPRNVPILHQVGPRGLGEKLDHLDLERSLGCCPRLFLHFAKSANEYWSRHKNWSWQQELGLISTNTYKIDTCFVHTALFRLTIHVKWRVGQRPPSPSCADAPVYTAHLYVAK